MNNSSLLPNLPASGAAALGAEDQRRIREMVTYLTSGSTTEALTNALPLGTDREMVDAVAELCELDHGGVLIIPPSVEAATAHLRALGLQPSTPIASTVVRDRLSRRYRLPAEALDVRVVHAPVAADSSRAVTVFCAPPGLPAPVARSERLSGHETHVAVRLRGDADQPLAWVYDLLAQQVRGLVADGGGYNPLLGKGGRTVMYFRSEGRTWHAWPRRLAVVADGHHEQLLQEHLTASTDAQPPWSYGARGGHGTRNAASPARPPAGLGAWPNAGPDCWLDGVDGGADAEDRRLLQLLTGAWVTQALRTMVALDLADHLARGPLTCLELADRSGARPDLLHRLLRALCHPWVGALQAAGKGAFALTGLGWRLTREHPASMRHTALLYGDLFYLSWSALVEGVLDGAQPFTTLFGQGVGEYLARHPRQGAVFDGARAEETQAFADLAAVVDLGPARTLVDVGGGNGELLCHLLEAYPLLDARLLDRSRAIGTARVNLSSRGLLPRTTLVTGSVTEPRSIPRGADVYVLTRILHDWDDDTCLEILRGIREAAADDSTLLIIERPLPSDFTHPSVAALTDLHMLVTHAGGGERTNAQYRALLERAGWTVADERPLTLDMTVALACPTVTDPGTTSSLPVGLYKYAR
ncbi:methyltransferase [Actinomadura napierensis]|uniref:O-methyltransferase domain-containing protein n=1 Tax=Actinomadura napierensis TaxID=267854 RepID=A0ABP5M551_9ACTN